MPNQTIPITLQAGVFPQGFQFSTPQEYATALAAILSGSIRADVSFIPFVLYDPTTFDGQLIFNVTQGIFKWWNTNTGSYQPLTPFQIGDVKNSFSGQDQVSVGWVVMNGRAISAIPGLTASQNAALESLFGDGGNLPNVTPLNGGSLPASDTFSGITKPTVVPADGVIAALPIGASYDQTEVTALRDATETLRDSTANVETQAAAIQDGAASLLTALRTNTTPPMYAMVFCGYS